MKLFSRSLIASVILTIYAATHACADDDIKKEIYRDCAKAQVILATLTIEQRATFATFIDNLLKAKASLAPHSPTAPQPAAPSRIGVPPLDEPKVGELVTINNAEREQFAKECALNLLPQLLPDAVKIMPTLFALEADSSLPEFLRAGAPRTAALITLRVIDETQILSLIDLAVRELEQRTIAGAQNVLFELFIRKRDFIIDRLIISALSEAAIAQLITVAAPADSLYLAEHFVREGGKKRGIGLALLSSLPPEAVLQPDIVRIAFETADIAEFMPLQDKILAQLNKPAFSDVLKKDQSVATAIIDAELRSAVKGADEQHKIRIAHLAAQLPSITSEFESEVQAIIRSHQPELLDTLINLAPKSTTTKKIKEDILKSIKDPSTDYWASMLGAYKPFAYGDIEYMMMTSSLLAKDIRLEYRSLLEAQLIDLFTRLSAADQKKYIANIKTLSKKKGASTLYKNSLFRILATIAPGSITAAQLHDVITAGSCSVLKDDVLITRSKVSADAFFSRLIGCMQIAGSTVEDVVEVLRKDTFSLDVRRQFIIQAVNNQLYDRLFRAELSRLAADVGISIEKISDTFLQLAADNDESVWTKALDGIGKYQKGASPMIIDLMNISSASSLFKLKQIKTALLIHSDTSPLSFDSLTALFLEALESERMQNIDEISSLNEDLMNSLLVKIIDRFPVELRPIALNYIARTTFHMNPELEAAISAQIGSKVEAVSDAALMAAFVRGIDVPIVREHLTQTIYTAARNAIFQLPESITIQGRTILETLFLSAPDDRQTATYRCFENRIARHPH